MGYIAAFLDSPSVLGLTGQRAVGAPCPWLLIGLAGWCFVVFRGQQATAALGRATYARRCWQARRPGASGLALQARFFIPLVPRRAPSHQ
ncbi:MAG: hypothetical protein IPO15_21455 [Anaerolineae bacterium]|uniref:hypothetical protein n=1 Tax=Candidatus Amarolinea dominans TaxID=3140696 RepID=UPI003136D538|nr:hypothetical protein [Anaerolineae bacterium]